MAYVLPARVTDLLTGTWTRAWLVSVFSGEHLRRLRASLLWLACLLAVASGQADRAVQGEGERSQTVDPVACLAATALVESLSPVAAASPSGLAAAHKDQELVVAVVAAAAGVGLAAAVAAVAEEVVVAASDLFLLAVPSVADEEVQLASAEAGHTGYQQLPVVG